MEFTLKKPNKSVYNLMRELGYHFQREELAKQELVLFRPVSAGNYPRFHLYLKTNENLRFNLHLDQKRPIYKGAPAHGGEYDGAVVEKEAERIKQTITGQ